uniref:Cytochrome P450 71A1 n=1 Tax=Cajanus cajan TaxID=3821 RepID=A0A151TEA3_CAJCA|nr:Cytochrome P450 71A1 [Cajanus cajan]
MALESTYSAINLSVLCVFLSVALGLVVFKIRRRSKSNAPPSPPKLPFIGNLHQLGTLPHRSLQALSRNYGPLMMLQMGQIPTLIVSSAHVAAEIFKNHDVVFSYRPKTTATGVFFYGYKDIGFSPYGEEWRQKRKVCVLELVSMKSVRSFQFIRAEEVAEMIAAIREACASGSESGSSCVHLSELLIALTNNTLSRCVFGQKYDSPDGSRSFGVIRRKLLSQFTAFCVGDFFPSLSWVDVLTGRIRKLKATLSSLDVFFDQDMFIGASDTTSTTLEWAMAELMKNPNTMEKVQEEVRRVVGNKAEVDENDVKQMNYLKCVVKETLRLHPPAPFLLPRETSSAVKLRGYDIPAKTRVMLNAWAIQRDPEFWEKPDEFIPERFEDSKVDFRGQDFEFIPFGVGRRGCPGITFGITLAEYALANLLRWFDWKLPQTHASVQGIDMSEKHGISVNKKVPLLLQPIPISFEIGSKP